MERRRQTISAAEDRQERRRQLKKVAEAIREAIVDNRPDALIEHIDRDSVSLGVDWKISYEEAVHQLTVRRGFLYCKLFDTSCFGELLPEEQSGMYAIRDILLEAPNLTFETYFLYDRDRQQENLKIGFMRIVWDGKPSDFGWHEEFDFPTAALKFTRGSWKLQDAFSPL